MNMKSLIKTFNYGVWGMVTNTPMPVWLTYFGPPTN